MDDPCSDGGDLGMSNDGSMYVAVDYDRLRCIPAKWRRISGTNGSVLPES